MLYHISKSIQAKHKGLSDSKKSLEFEWNAYYTQKLSVKAVKNLYQLKYQYVEPNKTISWLEKLVIMHQI